jgi:hypothetical protein
LNIQPYPTPKIVGCSIHVQCQKSKKIKLLDFFWILLDYWIGLDFLVQSNPKIQLFYIFDIERGLNNHFFGFSELDMVGCSIIHPIQNPEKT